MTEHGVDLVPRAPEVTLYNCLWVRGLLHLDISFLVFHLYTHSLALQFRHEFIRVCKDSLVRVILLRM
jgi:hypothetical protein